MNTNQANVTVLTDENGMQREYTEAKRKANVGDRVRIIWACKSFYSEGDIGLARAGGMIDFNGQGNRQVYGGGVWSASDEGRYVVLEPTSTVIIDGVRYREEKRKARTGELVRVFGHFTHKANGIFTVEGVYVSPEDGEIIKYTVNEDSGYGTPYYDGKAYVVLTPISEPATPSPASISFTINVTVASMDDAVKAAADAVRAELANVQRKSTDELCMTLAESIAKVSTPKPKTPQELRDEIVERAKADVAGLYVDDYYGGKSVSTDGCGHCRVKFVVNREKRTVVALLERTYAGGIYAKGIAKCAPGDVFNSHIGRAIALRRALGLEIPAEYTNAPQPESINAQVGDIVLFHGTKNDINAVVTLTKRAPELDNADNNYFGQKAFRHTGGYGGWIADKQFKILDDSREEVSA